MTNTPTELIKLTNGVDYSPVWISTDRRQPDPTKTTMVYSQVGGPTAEDKIGNTYGPIFRVEFVDVASITATHVKVWGIDNTDDDAAIYPVAYLALNPKLDIWLKKIEFTDADGLTVAGGTSIIYGHRKRTFPAGF